jgi:hypothetical protein
MSGHLRVDSRMSSIALRHIKPEHVEKALVHYAESAQAAIAAGRTAHPGLSPEKSFDCLEWSDHDDAFAQLAADNPHIAREPDAKQPLPTVKHGGVDYSAQIHAMKKEK